MVKLILSVIAGVATGVAVVFIGDFLSHQIYPPPASFNFADEEALKIFISNMPVWVLLLMVGYWLIAAFAGGLVSGKMNAEGWKLSSLLTGLVLLAATVANLYAIPHPMWMLGAAVFMLPCAWAGAWQVNKN